MGRQILLTLLSLGLTGFGCSEYRNLPGSTDIPGDEQYCAYCHSSPEAISPFRDTKGHEGRLYRGVGAHEVHLSGPVAAPIPCETCHIVPAAASDRGHMDSPPPAEVVFSGLAVKGGARPILKSLGTASPAYDQFALLTCENVYCHGSTLSGGKEAAPIWNDENPGRFSKCDSCHGFPPPLPHPTSKRCSDCHGDVVAEDGSFKDKARHVDGVLDVKPSITCTSCHGSGDSPAPPPDLSGHTSASNPGVGAHQAHLKASHGLASKVECQDCHGVPDKVTSPGHLDHTPGAEVLMSGKAALSGAKPSYERASLTCANVYCHGATLEGGKVQSPKWTDTSGAPRACDACHGFPPPPPHPQGSACGSCHGETASGTSIADPSKHIDGVLQVQSCNACHGNAENPAPPVDTQGRSDEGLVTVGAHQSHLKAKGGLSRPVACDECHKVPSSVAEASHLDGDGVAEVTFGALASGSGLKPTWNPDKATCTNVYCHGASLEGGTNTTPVWTLTDGSQKACGACHAVPPPVGRHPSAFEEHAFMGKNCTYCHQGVANSDGTAIVGPDLHINGRVDVAMVGGSYNSETKTCSPACHEPKSW